MSKVRTKMWYAKLKWREVSMQTELESKINMAANEFYSLLYEAGASQYYVEQIDLLVNDIIGNYRSDNELS